VGVNLLYAAFFHFHEPEEFVESLLDGLSTQRIEIDMIEFSGRSTFRSFRATCSRRSRAAIRAGKPAGVAETIRERRAFGWRPGHDRSAA